MAITMNLQEAEDSQEDTVEEEVENVEIKTKPDLPFDKIVESALFLANRELTVKEMSKELDKPRREVRLAIEKVRARLEEKDSPVQVVLKGDEVVMQVKPVYLSWIGGFSKKSDLSGKATRMLALIVKKKRMLQKDLRKYFRGEIYAYIRELKDADYIESSKHGNTRLLRPTRKFYDEFQLH